MNVISVYYSYRNPIENFTNFHPTLCTCIILRSRRWMRSPSFLLRFWNLQPHYDPMFDSLYITRTSHFRLYFFTSRDFVVPLFHPLFDPAAPYIAIHMAHPVPPAAPLAPASPPAWQPQVVPSLSLDDEDASEVVVSSSSLSSRPSGDYTPAKLGMPNGFLSSASD